MAGLQEVLLLDSTVRCKIEKESKDERVIGNVHSSKEVRPHGKLNLGV